MAIVARLAIVSSLPLWACSSEPTAPAKLRCDLGPTTGSSVSGWVTFEPMADHVHVKAQVTGLSPGRHGFHVHEIGDCSSGDGKSAGGHFNPAGMPHGGPDADRRNYDRMDTGVQLTGEESILGRAVIVHAGEDDLTTQPTGAAGARLACGVIDEAS
jgi:Cu-Zn family superoxide dismutase